MDATEKNAIQKQTWKNVSRTERAIRLGLAFVLLATALIIKIPIIYEIALFAFSGILVLTGLLRFSPMYALTGSCTCSANKDCNFKCA
jgi:hypothetical protein